jgi:hypothetical protein
MCGTIPGPLGWSQRADTSEFLLGARWEIGSVLARSDHSGVANENGISIPYLQLIADTTRAFRVLETSHPPTYYIPKEDVKMEHLSSSSAGGSSCEWKGRASYWDASAGGHWLPFCMECEMAPQTQTVGSQPDPNHHHNWEPHPQQQAHPQAAVDYA